MLTKIAAIVALTVSLMLHAAPAAQAETVHHAPTWMTTACQGEDQVNCYWDAHKMGNGVGHSYYARQFPGSARMVCVMYWQPRYARHHDYCVDNTEALRTSAMHDGADRDGQGE